MRECNAMCLQFIQTYYFFCFDLYTQDVYAWGRGRSPRGGDPLGLKTSGKNLPKGLQISSNNNEEENEEDEEEDLIELLPGSIAYDRAHRARAARAQELVNDQENERANRACKGSSCRGRYHLDSSACCFFGSNVCDVYTVR